MWRFFRIGVKNYCHNESLFQIRIIGTTSNNSECEDVEEEELNASHYIVVKESLASNASRRFNCNFQSTVRELSTFSQLSLYGKSSEDLQVPQNTTKTLCTASSTSRVDTPSNTSNPQKFNNLSLIKEKKDKFKSNDAQLESSFNAKKSKIKSEAELLESLIHKNKKEPENAEQSFGLLANEADIISSVPVDAEESETPTKDQYERRLDPQLYGRKMLELCKENKLKEAIDVLEVEMKAQGVPPNTYCFNVLINACGKVGYREKAFKLFYLMRSHGLKPEKFSITGMFNAIANSPEDPSDKLRHAKTFRANLAAKNVLLYPITYHAMIKAFGRCGDLETAFELADEMLAGKHVLTHETFNFLLQGCLSDRVSGFRHALMVWRKMRAMNITPSIHSYHLLLRCVRECGSGDPTLISSLMQDIEDESLLGKALRRYKKITSKSTKSHPASLPESRLQLEVTASEVIEHPRKSTSEVDEQDQVSSTDQSHQTSTTSSVYLDLNCSGTSEVSQNLLNATSQLPDLLAKRVGGRNVDSISSLGTTEEKLWIVGGVDGVLRNMAQDRVNPTVVTFTNLLQALPMSPKLTPESARSMEDSLLSKMEELNIVPDIIFCNQLIQRRTMNARRGLREARDVLDVMATHRLSPDLITFGCLALGCRRSHESEQLLVDMAKVGLRPNVEILSTLLRNSLHGHEFLHAIELLQKMRSLNVSPTEEVVEELEKARKLIRKTFIDKETHGIADMTPSEHRKAEEMKLFLLEYKKWIKRSKFERVEHPWAQFGYHDKRNDRSSTVSTNI